MFGHIRDEIVSGALAPRSRVDDARIAESLGVPRILVRESLVRLRRVGLVYDVAARRCRVAEASADDFRDAVEYLGSQVSIALRIAVPRMSAPVREFAAMLGGGVAVACLATPLSKPLIYERAFAFLDAIVEAAANPVLRVAFDRAWRDLLACSWGARLLLDAPEAAARQVRDLTRGISAGDIDAAEHAVRRMFLHEPDRSIS
ncbi:FCD domain-containing protein [Microbacterium betulae]|uniref:FCD domain-containing protein n=1 Tax=Microbacterium betulae TaxID=2981139 RepID=A0AA97FH39_9MICO|nr:FCD domain-containing protein [Microbacterium sp. AB]WOF22190.1 FCD domain-containing protein [Microbacterium sp. AB]